MSNHEDIQMKIYHSGDDAARLLPVSYTEWENRAEKILAAGPFGYVHGGAGAGDTMKANEAAFKKWVIRPRVCRDITKRDISTTLFGNKLSVPILLAPIGVNTILHPEGELAAARAAAKEGVTYILSNVSSFSMEEVAKEMGEAPRWFQLYPPMDEELSKSFLKRAEEAGYSAVVVTLDSTLLGWRETDLHNGYLPFIKGHGLGNYLSDPVFKSQFQSAPTKDNQEAVQKILDEGNNTFFTWKEVEQLKKWTKLPVLLKGLTHPEDALLAIEHGVDGIVVSNHGGRQLDGAIATLDALPAIAEAVNGRIPILLDSGVRRGADVLKALALGASAVLIGRPYAYGLAVAGESGVREVLQHMIAEFDLQLAIAGRSSIKEIDRSLIMRIDQLG